MNSLYVSACTACLVAVAGLLAFEAGKTSGENSTVENNVGKLAAEVHTNSESIALLLAELDKISNQLAVTGRQVVSNGVSDLEADDLTARLEAVENAVTAISQRSPAAKNAATASSVPPFNGLSQESVEKFSTRHYELAEKKFESGTGIPLGEYVSTIDDTLHTLENIEVQKMDCSDTICKISYSKTETYGSQQGADEGFELVDTLAQAAAGREVEITYAKDPAGDDLMYIQVR